MSESENTLVPELEIILAAKLEAMPFEDLLQPRHPDDPEKRPLILWVLGDTTEHFREHRETIERGAKESR